MGAAVSDDQNGYEIVPPQKAQGGYEITPPEKAPPAKEDPTYLGEIGSGIKRFGQSILAIPGALKDAAQPQTTTDKVINTVGGAMGPALVAGKHMAGDFIEGLGRGADARRTARAQGEGIPGQILATVENYPVIGGMVKKAEEGGTKMFSPQSIGAATEGILTAETPNLTKGVIKGAGKLADVATAEGNPGVVYKKYLDPVAHVPMEMPKNTPHIDAALVRKIEINYPEVAERVKSGQTTLGDLDIARQVANDASKAAYTARGLPTQISKGFKNAADSLRDTIYPKVEALHNLPEGSLSDLKKIQGSAIEMGKPPKWGHFPTRWPTVATERLAIRPAMDAARNVQTRVIDAGLPEPQAIGLRSAIPTPQATPSGILKARSEAARPEFGGEQAIPIGRKAPGPRPAIDVNPEAEPAMLRPPSAPGVASRPIPVAGDTTIPKLPPALKVAPAIPAEMLNLPKGILQEIEEMHRKGQLAPPRSKVINR